MPKEKVDATASPRFGARERPLGMFDEDAMAHRDYGALPPIDIPKWNAAGRNSSVFITAPPEYNMFPILGLAFADNLAALAIFEGFKSRYGAVDRKSVRGWRCRRPHKGRQPS